MANIMSKNSNTVPGKGILKKKSTFIDIPKPSNSTIPPPPSPTPALATQVPFVLPSPRRSRGQAHFDEINIMETHHPSDKDYGFDRIDEAKTPYHEYMEPEDDSLPKKPSAMMAASGSRGGTGPVDAEQLIKLLNEKGGEPPKAMQKADSGSNQPHKSSDFEARRKAHYDEFQKVKQLEPVPESGTSSPTQKKPPDPKK